ncbi:MAG TPA: VWA domain-containing protein [Planctomycetota bacterium]|nr:VWA domain-containing protein [Planctomycetota bacterium]
MIRPMTVFLSSLAAASALLAQAPPPAAAMAVQRPVDLAICLDISGSMNGLLNAARQNLWAVVNDLAKLQPAPTLRVALLTYGCSAYDPEKGWVRVETAFTTDLDAVSQKLFALSTNGGEEYVARVMQAALTELSWSSDPKALKLMFVAGNEPASQDPKVDGPSQSRAAIGQGIVVNTIYCGNPAHEEAAGWRAVATLADGKFAAIEQDNGFVVSTPFDTQLAELSAAMNTTYVPYGSQAVVWAQNQVAQDSNAAGLNSAAAATRCQTKASTLYCNSHWDLVDACNEPTFKLENVKKEDLPEALRKLSTDELRAHVAAQKKKRDEIKQQVEALGKQRDAHVQHELQRAGEAGSKLFEQAVLESVRQQAEARGFQRAVGSTVAPAVAPTGAPAATPGKDVDSPFAKVVKEAVRGYEKFALVTGSPRMAPTDCRMPAPYARISEAGKEHGGKLYLLYARFADGLEYVKPNEPAKVGQTIVKEAWQRVEGEQGQPTEASRRYMGPFVVKNGNMVCHGGDAAGLFVMHKREPGTPDTDNGWVYGTIDKNGIVTAAGRVASCMRCHENATEDRRFGLR